MERDATARLKLLASRPQLLAADLVREASEALGFNLRQEAILKR